MGAAVQLATLGFIHGEDAQAGVDFAHAGEWQDNAKPFAILEQDARAEADSSFAQVDNGAILKGGVLGGRVIGADDEPEEGMRAQGGLKPEVLAALKGVDIGRKVEELVKPIGTVACDFGDKAAAPVAEDVLGMNQRAGGQAPGAHSCHGDEHRDGCGANLFDTRCVALHVVAHRDLQSKWHPGHKSAGAVAIVTRWLRCAHPSSPPS